MTTYSEELACVQCDAKIFYSVRIYFTTNWYILNKECGIDCLKDIDFNNSLNYDRVRIVNLSNNTHTNYTICGYIQQSTMPCRYVCTMFDDSKYLVPSTYHIR